MKRLQVLTLDETNVTEDGAKSFEAEHPGCTVILDSWDYYGPDMSSF